MHTHKTSKIYQFDVHILSVIVWTVGIIIGIYAGSFISNPLSTAIYHSCSVRNTYFVPAAIVPLALTFLAARYSLQGMIYPILFFKAFFDGVILLALSHCFGSASWLMGVPALFADRVSTAILLYYSVRCLEDRTYRALFWFLAFLFVTICLLLLDHYVISDILILCMR